MKLATLCFPVKEGRMYLAVKKEGIGTGNLNGYGGKVKPGESPEEAAVRELAEESKVHATESALERVAIVDFFIGGVHRFCCHAFFLKEWDGAFQETEEMAAAEPFPLMDLPYDRMWKGDKVWLPYVVLGKKIRAYVYYGSDYGLTEFRWEPLE